MITFFFCARPPSTTIYGHTLSVNFFLTEVKSLAFYPSRYTNLYVLETCRMLMKRCSTAHIVYHLKIVLSDVLPLRCHLKNLHNTDSARATKVRVNLAVATKKKRNFQCLVSLYRLSHAERLLCKKKTIVFSNIQTWWWGTIVQQTRAMRLWWTVACGFFCTHSKICVRCAYIGLDIYFCCESLSKRHRLQLSEGSRIDTVGR